MKIMQSNAQEESIHTVIAILIIPMETMDLISSHFDFKTINIVITTVIITVVINKWLATNDSIPRTNRQQINLNAQHDLIATEVDSALTEESKRKRYITWDEYFMAVAKLAGRRSKDPSTQVGACIVNENNKIIGSGYNGMPNGVDDGHVPWAREGPYLETKYAYVVHAELNAILNCVLTDQRNCRIYVSLFPCNECAKAIIQSGIKHVIYLSDKHKHKDSTIASKKMFDLAQVKYEQYNSS